MLLLLLLLLVCSLSIVSATSDGGEEATSEDATSVEEDETSYVLELDEDNFHRTVLDTTKNFLVEIYSGATEWSQAYAPTYEKVAAVFKDEGNCVVAKIDVNKYRQIAKIYEWGGFMRFFLFPADVRVDGELYEGSRSLDALVAFLNHKCGTSRLPDGRLDTSKGRLPAFDKLAADFVVTMETLKDDATKEKETGIYYTTVMKKMLEEDGDSFVTEEMARLQKILQGYMTSEKRAETIARYNILSVFNGGSGDEDAVEGEGHVTPDDEVKKDAGKVRRPDDVIMETLMTGQTVSGKMEKKEL